MGFRNILISEESILRVKLNNLIILQVEKEEVSVPVNDINSIVIDNLDTTLTTRLLENLAQNNIVVIMCDKKHLPIGMFLGMNIHSRSTKVTQKQIMLSDELKAELWQHIIKAKIRNQKMLVEELFGENDDAFLKLSQFQTEVEPFDSTNREAHSAKLYFTRLFGHNYRRDDDDILINSALNYGYAIVRACIARHCVAYGLNTTIGIFHKSEYNQFNLADDLIEPFRPIVDKLCIHIMKGAKFFMPHHREQLIRIVDHKILHKNKKVYLETVLEEYVASYSSFLNNKNMKTIHLPSTIYFDLEVEW